MTSTYRFHEGVAENVPYYARYQYPTQANKAWKSSVKIAPKNGGIYSSAQSATSIDIELPAQGYLNPRNCTLEFDLALSSGDPAAQNVRVQNNVTSIFNRARLSYGSLPLEDIQDVNILTRIITEFAGHNTFNATDQNALLEGIGGSFPLQADVYDTQSNKSLLVSQNTRVGLIQAANYRSELHTPRAIMQSMPTGSTPVANTNAPVRRYTIQLPFGLMQQDKLLPLKWMASQLKISLYLARPADCLVEDLVVANQQSQAQYVVSNVAFNAELLEYDASYDAAFLEGLRGDGV